MSKSLFSEFEEVSSKQWKQKIQYDLKGADYNETLIKPTLDGIDVKPFYHADDFKEVPGVSDTQASEWKIGQFFYAGNQALVSKNMVNALKRGAETLVVRIPKDDFDPAVVFKEIPFEGIQIHLIPEFVSEDFFKKLSAFFADKKAQVYLHTDIVGHLARSGNWYQNQQKDVALLKTFINNPLPFQSVLSVDVSLYQNAGATITQQLAYALAHANEYLNLMESADAKAAQEHKEMVFNMSVGGDYFFEIAKLRALRWLWDTLIKEYNLNIKCHILAYPSKRNKTLYDYNVNMLRTTTECMSAILGGANTICNMAYDALYHKANEFGERISRNQLLLMKHESYLDKVDNPADGAYFIESLTEQLAAKALEIFKQIETGGGFISQLHEHNIQRKIKESAEAEQQVLIGTTKYPNPADRMQHDLELYPFVKMNSRKTLIQPIIERRLAEKTEQERLKKESE